MPTARSTAIMLCAFACALCLSLGAAAQDPGLALPNSITAPNQEDSDDFADYFAGESEFELTALWQQPGTPPSLAAARPSATATRSSRQSNIRLASVPNMFGDAPTTMIAGQVTTDFTPFISTVVASFPTPGYGGLGAKLAENDRPIPTDRVFFSYHHSHNAFTLRDSFGSRQQHLKRTTFGFEKTFADGWNSVELRVPFNASFDAGLDSFGIDGGSVGNLAVVLKQLLYTDGSLAIGAGAAIDAPTGEGVTLGLAFGTVEFRNEAVHILPFIGFNYAPSDPWWGWGDGFFATGIMQVNVAANGNTIEVTNDGTNVIGNVGKLNDQTLLFLDLNLGYWLYRDPDAPRWTGVALVGELHYTTTLQDSDSITASDPARFPLMTFGAPGNRFDILNATIGLDTLMFDASSFRIAGAFPLRQGEDSRLFDAEIQFQFNRRF